jgi:hypothetical protein
MADPKFYESIDRDADFYQPAVYNLLSFYHSLQQESEGLDGQFIPLTTVQPWEQERSLFFAVGLLPPPVEITDKLLDRSASVLAFDETSYDELIDENPDVGSSSTGDLPGQTSGISTSTTIPNGPKSTNSSDFWDQYVAMCNRLGCQPEELARVIQSESRFNPAAQFRRTPDGPATAKGLIQLIRPTAIDGLGMTEAEYDNLQNTSATDQLKWVEAFYQGRAKGKNAFELKSITLGGFNNPDGSIYNANARALGYKNPRRQEQAYRANAHFDTPPPPKGFITPVDRNKRLAKKPLRKSIQNKINGARRRLNMDTNYVPFQPDSQASTGWQPRGSKNANVATKTAAQVANADLNQTNLGKQFQAQQLAQKKATREAIQQMANTPPLRLLVNPRQFRVAAEKIISDGNWGRNGPIIEHWGENQDTVEGSGKIAAFYSLDVAEGNSPGLSRTARQFSASYQNLLSLWLIYRNNGGIYLDDPLRPEGSKNKNLTLLGSVYLYYDHTLYIGSFDNFSITETETDPFTLEYNFSFKVRATFLLDHFDDPQYTYGQPTTPTVPVTSATIGGEQTESNVALPSNNLAVGDEDFDPNSIF